MTFFDMFVVYDTTPENVKAFFVAEGDAINYAAPNGWTVKPAKVQVPFYLAVNPV
jgi:hypothetical protein